MRRFCFVKALREGRRESTRGPSCLLSEEEGRAHRQPLRAVLCHSGKLISPLNDPVWGSLRAHGSFSFESGCSFRSRILPAYSSGTTELCGSQFQIPLTVPSQTLARSRDNFLIAALLHFPRQTTNSGDSSHPLPACACHCILLPFEMLDSEQREMCLIISLYLYVYPLGS